MSWFCVVDVFRFLLLFVCCVFVCRACSLSYVFVVCCVFVVVLFIVGVLGALFMFVRAL